MRRRGEVEAPAWEWVVRHAGLGFLAPHLIEARGSLCELLWEVEGSDGSRPAAIGEIWDAFEDWLIAFTEAGVIVPADSRTHAQRRLLWTTSRIGGMLHDLRRKTGDPALARMADGMVTAVFARHGVLFSGKDHAEQDVTPWDDMAHEVLAAPPGLRSGRLDGIARRSTSSGRLGGNA